MAEPPPPGSDPRLLALGNLLQLEDDLRGAESEAAVEFIVANDTFRLFPYRQAVLWRPGPAGAPEVRLHSGLSEPGGDSPYRQWLNGVARHLAGEGAVRLIGPQDLPAALAAEWAQWLPVCAVYLPLPAPTGEAVGGLLFARDVPPGESEFALLARLGRAFGQALWSWRQPEPPWRRWLAAGKTGRGRRRLAWAALAAALLPLRLSVLAPAEIVGKDAKLVAAPADGVVARFYVEPNQAVAAGAPLVSLDDTVFRNRYEVARKAQAVAQAEHLRATQKAFADDASKAELAGLQARLEEKMAETQYSKEMAGRIVVSAPEAGVAVFSDASDWLGKPVQTGERILTLADPARVQVAISLPVDDAINLEPGAEVKLSLNVAPLSSLAATLTQTSYEPASVPEGFVAYRLRADLAAGEALPRLGLKGTARLYGAWAPLIYHVLRKPLAAARRWAGV